MNGEEVADLKDGDVIEFTQNFLPFSLNKSYIVKKRENGAFYVQDDSGLYHPLMSTWCLEHHFEVGGVK